MDGCVRTGSRYAGLAWPFQAAAESEAALHALVGSVNRRNHYRAKTRYLISTYGILEPCSD